MSDVDKKQKKYVVNSKNSYKSYFETLNLIPVDTRLITCLLQIQASSRERVCPNDGGVGELRVVTEKSRLSKSAEQLRRRQQQKEKHPGAA